MFIKTLKKEEKNDHWQIFSLSMSIVDRGQLFFVFSGWVLKEKYLTNGRSSRNRWHFRSSTLTASTAYWMTQQVLAGKLQLREVDLNNLEAIRGQLQHFFEHWNIQFNFKYSFNSISNLFAHPVDILFEN